MTTGKRKLTRLREIKAYAEKCAIIAALRTSGGDVNAAALNLDVQRTYLHLLIRKHQLVVVHRQIRNGGTK